MTEAIYALIGIAIGAVLSGTVQIFIAWRERVNRGRAAARILFADTVALAEAYKRAVETGSWWPNDLSFGNWEGFHEALAIGLSADDFHSVAAAFFEAGHDEAHRLAYAPEADFKDRWEDVLGNIERAQSVLYRTGLTWRERRREERQEPTT